MLLQSLYFSRFLQNCPPPLKYGFDTHARWQPVTQSARSRQSYAKIEDCEQSRSFFSRAFAQSSKSNARLYPFDKPMKSLYFRSFLLSILFALFISRSYENRSIIKVVQLPQDWFDTQTTAVQCCFATIISGSFDVICEGAFHCVSDLGNTLAGTVFSVFNLFSLVWNN